MTNKHSDEHLDRAVEDSFPASDAPASTGITGPRTNRPSRVMQGPKTPSGTRGDDTRPKGTHDRHASETAYQREHEEHPPRRR
jgi:hypothetical protein